jgi:hypothetical protein
MAIRDVVKVSRKTFFNPKAWFGWDEMKFQFITIVSILRDLFSIAAPLREETFEQAMVRFNITEADRQNLSNRYFYFAWFFIACFLLVFAYAFFLLFAYGAFFACLMALAVAAFFLSQAFRFHFWHYQLAVKRLGVTFQEWKNAFLGSKE